MSDAIQKITAAASNGLTASEVTATVLNGRAMTPAERQAFDRARGIWKLREAKRKAEKRARGPMTAAERMRKKTALANDLPEPAKVRHPRLKEYCRYNLEAFGWYYCRQLLKHRASKDIREGLIKDVQECILHGGKAVKLYGRGTGKSTWINDIATIWATFYGHKRFPVCIAATAAQAKKNLKRIKRVLATSEPIAQDFAAIAEPIRALNGISQKCASQTYHGEPTNVEWGSDQISLPILKDENGEQLEVGGGAVIAAAGIGGAIRGANVMGQRPDFLILDDPQTKKIAHSPKMVEDVIDYIHQDALFLAGHDKVMSAFVTITPQCYGDVAGELTNKSKHPEWAVTREPFLKSKCEDWLSLVAEYCGLYAEDMAAGQYHLPRSRSWYLEHRDEFAGCSVLDPEQYDHEKEEDAIHHVLNLRAALGEIAFNAEIMMEVSDVESDVNITPDIVSNALNGYKRNELPPGTEYAFAFCDVNTQEGGNLSWAIVAFGRGRVAAVINYGRWPEHGNIIDANMSVTAKQGALKAALYRLIAKIAGMRLYKRDGENMTPVKLTALGIDRGFMPNEVMFVCDRVRNVGYYPGGVAGPNENPIPLPFQLDPMRGVGWRQYGGRHFGKMVSRGVNMYEAKDGERHSLVVLAPYWREVMQSSWLASPFSSGSLSIFGDMAVRHYAFAQEVCAEKLLKKYVDKTSGRIAWDWAVTGANHWCDAVTGCFALASWFRCYETTGSMLSVAMQKRIGETAEGHDDSIDMAGGDILPKVQEGPPAPALVRKPKPIHRFKKGRYIR